LSPSFTEAFANASNLDTANSTRTQHNEFGRARQPDGIVRGPKIAIRAARLTKSLSAFIA
jgi:hypothetical protein